MSPRNQKSRAESRCSLLLLQRRERRQSDVPTMLILGLAAASAARILGKRATICVTSNTPQRILDRLKTEGAEVRQNGYYWSDADDLCRELVAKDPQGVRLQLDVVDLLYCPPFDHEDVIDGNATMVYEIVEQMKGRIPDAIICCVGGGGLIGGIFKGLQTVNLPGWDKGRQYRSWI